MAKGDLPDLDPRGLIWEAYRIEGITAPDCRTIFFDWALGLPADRDAVAAVGEVLAHYGTLHPAHPMTEVLKEGLTPRQTRAGGRRGRQR